MTEFAERYARLAAEFTRRVEAVPTDRWDSPSPCEDWTARGVVKHVIETEQSVPTYAGQEPLRLERSTDDDPLAAWAEVRDQVQALLDDPARASTSYDGFFGPTTLEQTIDTFFGLDLLVHGWDLARATGQDETLPADDVHDVYETAVGLGDNLRMGGVCGPAVEVPADSSEQDKLLAFLGRTP